MIQDDLLFTHKGLSGPVILKSSLYWSSGERLKLNLIPKVNFEKFYNEFKNSNQSLKNVLLKFLPQRFLDFWFQKKPLILKKIVNEMKKNDFEELIVQLQSWEIFPKQSLGYKKAEVTRGGVSVKKISSKTMESQLVENLYFIGEVLDVTGQLGGYNFQWAWSSAHVCAKDIMKKESL